MLVNAGGPWVGDIIQTKLRSNSSDGVRLVRGSHIVTRKLFDHDKCYFFQGTDGRIIFAIPYETDFTLIGTTDAEHDDPSTGARMHPGRARYLLNFVSQLFQGTGHGATMSSGPIPACARFMTTARPARRRPRATTR